MCKDKELKYGTIRIEIYDERAEEGDDLAQNFALIKTLKFDKDDDSISFFGYVNFCKSFARAFGWSDKTIEKVFLDDFDDFDE